MRARAFWDERARKHGPNACHYLDFWKDAFAYLWRLRTLETIRLDGRILEIGAGTGLFAWLWPGAISVDFSERMISNHPGRFRVCADARRLPFKSSVFDNVIAVTAMQFILRTEEAILEIDRALGESGTLVILDDFSKKGRPWHFLSYKNWHLPGWWEKQLQGYEIEKRRVTGLDQKLFARLGPGLIVFCLSVLLEPIWKLFTSRYECWICEKK